MSGESLLVTIGADIAELRSKMEESEGLVGKFKDTVGEIAEKIAAAFAVEKIAEFAFEVSELAGKAAGVKNAFYELQGANTLLTQMKETTHGTVSELDLMKDAVHAQNLNIPLKDLGTILEFVHIRAQATDGDFKSMADTLITAIGKGGAGAKKAMAELQISTEDYTKALNETGNVVDAVMKIAKEKIEQSKGKIDETAQAIESSAAAWDDFKVNLGEALNKSTILASTLTGISEILKIISSEDAGFWEKAGALFAAGTGNPYEMYALQAKMAARHIQADAEKDNKNGIVLPEITITGDSKAKEIRDQAEAAKELAKQQEAVAEAERRQDEYMAQLRKEMPNSYRSNNGGDATGLNNPGMGSVAGIASTQAPDSIKNMTAAWEELRKKKEQVFKEDAKADYWNQQIEGANKMAKQMEAVQRIGEAAVQGMAKAFQTIIDGTATAGQATGKFVEKFGMQMLTMALSGIIAAAMDPESNMGNYYLALALAGAGIAAVGAMFAGIGVGSGGGAAAGAGAGASWTGGQSVIDPSGTRQRLDVSFQPINGTQLKAVITNQGRYDNKVTGG